ncbi:MAG: MBL fold metallo-hydrolase [Dehalococcoidia bacterium]|nr:MAG: MBL fold metallo-hydrolase [Dehalococcoidia bacterium]
MEGYVPACRHPVAAESAADTSRAPPTSLCKRPSEAPPCDTIPSPMTTQTTPTSPTPRPIRIADNNLWPFPLATGGTLLVDAGWEPDADPAAWPAIEAQLTSLGLALRDIRVVVVTHEHIDHAGLAARWAAVGARIVAAHAAVPALTAGLEGLRAQRLARAAELARHGAPSEVTATLLGARTAQQRWEPCPIEDITPAEDAPTYPLADGRTLRLRLAPGHTPGNLVATIQAPDDAEGLDLCSGDTLLPTTIPTPGLHFPHALAGDTSRWPSLPPFLRSVAALRALPITRILPGHGDVVAAPLRLFAQFEDHHARRGARVRAALEAAGAATAFEVARAVFPRLPHARIAQAMTETIGHLDVLAEAGVARAETTDDLAHVVWHHVSGTA